jgi:hypothetical protein
VAVYACKKAGVLDAPFTVGTVQKLQADDDNPLLWVVFVKPAVNFEEVTTVNVIVMNN